MRFMKIVFLLLIALALTACSRPGKTVNTDEYFTLKQGEAVNVSGTDLKLKMLENGTAQRPSGGDSVFCKIEVSYKGKAEEKILEVSGFASYGQWNLRVEKVNTGIDPSRTSCLLIVTKTLG
jgi:hypothetical protein